MDPDEILVSFDVVSLFTCIPTHLAIEVVKKGLDSDQTLLERTNLFIQNIMTLLHFVLDNNFFVFQGSHFQQIFGCPMGSPVSAILANLVMEHVEEKAERIAKVLRDFNIKVAHKPIPTISNIPRKPKDKIEKEAFRGVVYKIKCKDCDSVYVGQTSRALKTRVKENTKAIETLDKNSLLAKHHVFHGHQIDLENVEIIDRSSTW